MTESQRAIVKWLAVGYRGLTDRERMIVAYAGTPGGCPSCGGAR